MNIIPGKPSIEAPRIARSIAIRRPAIALYTAWYHLSQRPAVSLGAESAPLLDNVLPRIKAPCGYTAGATFIADHIHGLFIAWKSDLVSGVQQSGEVWFHTDTDSAISTVSILLSWHGSEIELPQTPPSLFADIAQLDQDLHHFKTLMER